MSTLDVDRYVDADGQLITERLYDLTAIELQQLGDAMQRRADEATAGEVVAAAALVIIEEADDG